MDFVVRVLRALDARDYHLVAESFADEGVWDRGGEKLVGPASVLGAMERRPADLQTQHLASNMVVDVEANGVAVVSYTIYAYAQQSGAPYHLHAVLKAQDRLTRAAGTWRFLHRAVEPAFSGGG